MSIHIVTPESLPIYAIAPQEFIVTTPEGEDIARMKHSRKLGFNFDMKINYDQAVDKRLLIAAGVLIGAIEGA